MIKILVIILILSLGLGVIAFIGSKNSPPIINLNNPIHTPYLINTINSRNASIHSFAGKLEITANPYHLTGTVYYEKNKHFRLRTESRFGVEGDIGSNDSYFWFWSHRMSPPTLYYAQHQDYLHTRLKAPFNPDWMIECLNISDIHASQTYVQGTYYLTRELIKNNDGQNLAKITIIDPKLKLVVGHYLCDSNNQAIASTEVQEFQTINGFIIPKKIKINWFEENICLVWMFTNVQVNGIINANTWVLPSMKRMVDMSRMP